LVLKHFVSFQPPKQKFINYRELLEQNRAKRAKEKEEEENVRIYIYSNNFCSEILLVYLGSFTW